MNQICVSFTRLLFHIHLLCGTHSTHNACMYYRLYDGTWTICNWSGRRRASNFQSTLPRTHYPLYRSTEDRLFFAFFWTCIIHGYEDQDRVTITTGINIKIVLKLCNVGSMVKGVYGEDNWSFNLLGIIRIENNGSFTPLLRICASPWTIWNSLLEEVLIIKVWIYHDILLIRRLYFFDFLSNWNSLLEKEDLLLRRNKIFY